MRIIFTELAAKEFSEAESFYEIELQGLGVEFSNEITKSVKRISNFPESYPIIKNEIRKFPYNLFYSIENDFVLIISIAHQHRKPFYWA